MIEHRGPISGVAAHNSLYVASAGYDNQVILWDAGGHTAIARVLHDHLANQCAFNATGDLLVSSSSDYTARIWSVPDMRLKSVLAGHDDDVEMSAFDPHGSRVATCSRDFKARVFDLDGRLLVECEGHESDAISIAWSRGGSHLITSSDDGTVREWDARTGTCTRILDFGEVETDTIAIADETLIYAGNDAGEIILVTPSGNTRFAAHRSGVKRLVYSPEQRLLISLSYDRSLLVWRVGPGGELQQVDRTGLPPIVWPRSCALLGAGKIVFGTFGSTYATYDLGSKVWDVDGITPDMSLNGVAVREGSVFTIGDAGILHVDGEPRASLGSLCNFLTPYRSGMLSGGQLGQLFEVTRGECFYTHTSPINCCAVYEIEGRQWAIFGTYGGEGLVFDLESDPAHPTFVSSVRLHDNAVKGLAVSGGEIFSVCATGAAAFHSVRTLEEISRIGDAHDKIANGCTAVAEGVFASVSRDLTLRIWKDRIAQVIRTPHKKSIKCVAASKDGSCVATGSYGGGIAVYSMTSGQWILNDQPTPAGISSIAVEDTGKGFIATSYDGGVHAISVGA